MKAKFIKEYFNFNRENSNLFKKIGIGLEAFIPEITESDLEYFCLGKSYLEMLDPSDNDYLESIERFQKVKQALKGHVKIGKFFDHKSWRKIELYLLNSAHNNSKFQYVYNAYPNGDGYQIVFTDIELPLIKKLA